MKEVSQHPEAIRCRQRYKKEPKLYKERLKEWREKNPDKYTAQYLRSKYGMTFEEYTQKLKEQNGVCAICFNPPKGRVLQVDHDHETEEIRGLLCNECNNGIGRLKDNKEIITSALKYISKYK